MTILGHYIDYNVHIEAINTVIDIVPYNSFGYYTCSRDWQYISLLIFGLEDWSDTT